MKTPPLLCSWTRGDEDSKVKREPDTQDSDLLHSVRHSRQGKVGEMFLGLMFLVNRGNKN